MQSLMPPIDSSDSLFHNGNPLTGEKGTIVTAEWLNAVQSAIRSAQAELISVLTAAGIDINPEQSNQLLTALSSAFAAKSGNLTAFSALPGKADALPFFTAANTMTLATLTTIGRTIIGKPTAAEVLAAISGAPLASPTFTGTPAVPTALSGTSTTQIASTAFVQAALNLLSLGTASQRAVGTGTNQIPDMNSFANLQSAAGYQKLPGGVIIQWGGGLIADAASVTLPIAFPNYFASVNISSNPNETSRPELTQAFPSSTSTFVVGSAAWNGTSFSASSLTCRWLAIGY